MAQLQPTDKFIVDRGGSTYKTTFQDIEESLDIDVSHEYNAEVLATVGGEIETFTITDGGTGFIVGQNYEAESGVLTFQFTASGVSGGVLTEIQITSNDPIETPPVVFTANPIVASGALATVTEDETPPAIPDGSSIKYKVRQTLEFDDIDDDGNVVGSIFVLNTSAEVELTNNGGTFEFEITKRGEGYDPNEPAYLEVTDVDENTSDGAKVTITTTDPSAGDFDEATITIDSVNDGVDTDKAKLTVTVGGVEKNIYLVPGKGIRFNNFEKSVDGEDQIEIVNTLTEFGESGGGTISDGASVIVSPDAPTVQVYNIKDGTLWYNLSNGRLYVAVTYISPTGTSFDWIDASPSSFNDSLRKNQNDSTSYNLRVERNEDLNPDGGSFYAYHFNLEELPLIS